MSIRIIRTECLNRSGIRIGRIGRMASYTLDDGLAKQSRLGDSRGHLGDGLVALLGLHQIWKNHDSIGIFPVTEGRDE